LLIFRAPVRVPVEDYKPLRAGVRTALTAEESATLRSLCVAKSYRSITVRGTKFTTEAEAKKRTTDESGAMFLDVQADGTQKTLYGTIKQILVMAPPGQPEVPYANMVWHQVDNEDNCHGRLPLLQKGKANAEENLNEAGVPFSRAYAQNVCYLPWVARDPKNGEYVALYRLSDYNPLHDLY